jgi:ferrous iron transport protein A
MTSRAPTFHPAPADVEDRDRGRVANGLAKARSLADLPPGEEARVADVVAEADLAAWLTALGIGAGERVTVLRRAILGGPLHVRTASGGEFALDARLARAIVLAREASRPSDTSERPGGDGDAA